MARDDGGPYADGAARVFGVGIRVDGGVVARGEADVAAVDHRHRALFLVGDTVRAAGIAQPGALAEDRGAVRRCDYQFGLEDPGLVPADLRLPLPVDEEERDDPLLLVPADGPAHDDLGLLFRHGPLRDLTLGERHGSGDGLDGLPFPYEQGVIVLALERGAGSTPVAAPAGGYLYALGVAGDGEGHAERGGEGGGALRGGDIRGAVFCGPDTSYGELVELLGRVEALAPGGEHAGRVALGDPPLGDLFLGSSGGTEQVGDYQAFELVPDLMLRGWGQKGLV